jgi:ribosomal protein S18 acetylase RimI-like enzyme
MNLKILRTEDPELVARLNHDVQNLHYEIEPELFKPFSLESMTHMFAGMLRDPAMSAYVAYVDETPAAYLVVAERTLDENAFRYAYKVLYIDQVCVNSGFKGQGIGKALVDFAKQLAKESQINRIEMNYWTKNNNSGEFFRSQGFTNFNERLFYKVD